jgi:SAM-dependent methyltransferase
MNEVAANGFSSDFLDVMQCPSCGGRLEAQVDATRMHGALRCLCGLTAPIRNGVARFVPDDGYVSSFSYEWRKHARTQLDSASHGERSEKQFQLRLNRPLDWLEGKLVLDAGCGSGRFAEIAARHGGTVVVADFSFAIDVARENLSKYPNVHYVQADLNRLPLKPETFDLVYSFGVLHHTPDARQAFQSIAKRVKSGGVLSMFVYASYNKALVYSSDFWRRLSTKLPHQLLYSICAASVPLYYLYSLPVVGSVGKALLPISMEPDWRWRWLDTFDWYSPHYQSKHTHAEVAGWFAESGFDDLFIGIGEVTMGGVKR